MILKYMKNDAIDLLKNYDLNENLKNYSGDNSWLITKYQNNGIDLFGSYEKKQFKDFTLICSESSANDFENMKIIYESLKELTNSQASDERIWAGLAHNYCWEYMQKRWPLPEDKNKMRSHILNNYFFWNSTKAVFLNGISRLWWYAKYTYDESFENPYMLTKYICENDLNGKIYPLLSCRFAMDPQIFKNILLSIKEYEEEKNTKLSRDQFGELKKYLNRLSGKIVIDTLSFNELKEKIYSKLDTMLN